MRVLTEEGEQLAYLFRREQGDRGCTCFISPPCGHCMHEGNPLNLSENSEYWQDVWDLDEACEQARENIKKFIKEL